MSDPQISPQKIRPSRWYYLIALALIAAGALCGYQALAAAIDTLQGGLTQAVFPGETTVSFPVPGNYKIYYEDHSEFNGRVFDTGSQIPGLTFTVTDSESGEVIPLHRPGFNETYNLNGRTGRAVLQFHIAKSGSYNIAASYDDNQKQEDAVFAVGSAQIGRFTLLIFGVIGSIFGFGVAALLVIVLIEVRRSSSKRKLQAAPSIQGTSAPPPPL
jgi:hypothetical protein